MAIILGSVIFSSRTNEMGQILTSDYALIFFFSGEGNATTIFLKQHCQDMKVFGFI
jgi:hypothetical protein